MLVLTFPTSKTVFVKYKQSQLKTTWRAEGSFRSPEQREETGNEVEFIQEIFNDDLEEIATWRQNDLLAIQNGDSRLFGAKIDLETCNAANTIEETMYIGGGYGKKRQ